MKIVHISHLYHPSQGGVQFFFKNISERLVKNYGDDVTVVTTDSMYGPERKIYKNAGPKEELINGVKVLRFPFVRSHIKPLSFLAKGLKKLSIDMPESLAMKAYGPVSPSMKKYLLKVDADAFCASSINYYFMQLPLWRKCNFFFYGSIHLDRDEGKKAMNAAQLQAIKASTLYLANTAYEKERIEKLGIDASKVFVLGTGVDVNDFNCTPEDVSAFKQKWTIPLDAIVVGYVGRIEKPKNVQLLLKSFLQVASANEKVYLVIAGSANTHLDELKLIAKTFPETIANRIRWVINFSHQEKTLVFNALDILVLTSHNESFGLVFLEAWSCKKPVIGTNIGAIKNVISNKVDGLLINMNDENDLADKIITLVDDAGLRKTLGQNGFNKVKENYTWDIIVARLRKCYTDALTKTSIT